MLYLELFLLFKLLITHLMLDKLIMVHRTFALVYFYEFHFTPLQLLLKHILHILFFLDLKQRFSTLIFFYKFNILFLILYLFFFLHHFVDSCLFISFFKGFMLFLLHLLLKFLMLHCAFYL